MISDKAKAIHELAKEMDKLLEDSQRINLAMQNCTNAYLLNMRKHSNSQEVISQKLAALQDTIVRLQYEAT